MSALAGLSNLTSLSLSFTQVSDVSALAGLSKLEMLWTPDRQLHMGQAAVQAAIANYGK